MTDSKQSPPWRGAYVEYAPGQGTYLIWGPNRFIGSARSPQELAGTLERMSTAEGIAQEERRAYRETKLDRGVCVPHFSADDTERQRQIQDYLANYGATKPKHKSKKQPSKHSTAVTPPTLEDLGL